MKTLSITLEDNLYKQLREIAHARQVSSFVSEAIKGHIQAKMLKMMSDYEEAAKDESRMSEIDEWRAIDAEGWK